MSNLDKDQQAINKEHQELDIASTRLTYKAWRRSLVFKDYWGNLLVVKPAVTTQLSFGFFNPKRRK